MTTKTRTPRRPPANPALRFIFDELRRQDVTLTALAQRAGYDKTHLSKLRRKGNPSYELLADCLQVLGFELSIVPTRALKVGNRGAKKTTDSGQKETVCKDNPRPSREATDPSGLF